MSDIALDTTVLQQLDGEPRQLLDVIDNLRSLGVDSYVDLPQIVVVGDQSSGKSSVLEAISRVKFPSRSGLCTRFATELVLRTSPEPKVDVRILSESGNHTDGPGEPGQERSPTPPSVPLSRQGASEFSADELADIIEEAKAHMGLDGGNATQFSDKVLRVQIQGPEMPQLTLVDLPGFFQSATAEQSAEGRPVVEALAARYMRQKSSIILAIVSAKSGPANQQVLTEVGKHDPHRERTMGIITKPDSLERGSEEERRYLQLARNEEPAHRLRLGWHVLRNRSELQAGTSSEERDAAEAEFFNTGAWTNIGRANKGVAELRVKLSNELFNHIKRNLPGVINAIQTHVLQRERRLAQLGDPRVTPEQHRAYLGRIAQQFEMLSRDGVYGMYASDFFGGSGGEDLNSDGWNVRKLRASVRQLHRTFAAVLELGGPAWRIRMPNGTRIPAPATTGHYVEQVWQMVGMYDVADPPEVTWEAMNRQVAAEALWEQGTELPGSQNARLAFQKFQKLAQPWGRIAARHVELMLEQTRRFVDELLAYIAPDAHTQAALLAECVDPFFEAKRERLAAKLDELLEHYRGGYAQPLEAQFLRRLSQRMARRATEVGSAGTRVSEFDTEGIIDNMLTYYEMSLHTFTENVMVLAIENCLVKHIPEILPSTSVNTMDLETLARLGTETRAVRDERETLQRDLEVLRQGLHECKKHRLRELVAPRPSPATQLPALASETAQQRSPAVPSDRALLSTAQVESPTTSRHPNKSRGASASSQTSSSTPALSSTSSPASSKMSATQQPGTPVQDPFAPPQLSEASSRKTLAVRRPSRPVGVDRSPSAPPRFTQPPVGLANHEEGEDEEL